MCGIAGFVNTNGQAANPHDLQAMTDIIAHRGPDGEGQWLNGPVAIGHRRLAIIDTSDAAKQPMLSHDPRYVLSYNGEVYNFRELRKELQAAGYQFTSHSDTEVVLNALIQWGEAALLRFNGMFALAFYDRKLQRLLVARDRYGIKPLYYSSGAEQFAFASEQKAIWTLPAQKHELDHEALLEYFTFQNIFTDKTLDSAIQVLPAGHYGYLEISVSGAKFEIQRYWDFEFAEQASDMSQAEAEEELDRLMTQAVTRQLVSDVELGAYLSGGIDSGSITSIAAQQLPYVKTFTCGFDLSSASGIELNYDERQKAEYMSYKFKTEHYEMVLKSGDMERCMEKLVWHMEEPRVGQSYPNLYASKLASKFVKVVLSGTGGDELFAGYPWRYYRSVGSKSFDHYIDDYYAFWQRLAPNKDLIQMFAPISEQVSGVWTRDIFKTVFTPNSPELSTPEGYINASLYFESKTFLSGLLMVEDKLSMAHSLESRVPFLDNDLVDFAMRCPIRMKLNNLDKVIRLNENDPGNKLRDYYQKTRDGKQILRSAMQRKLPGTISSDTKQGFSAPDASWFKGESIDYINDALMTQSAQIYSYFDFTTVTNLISEHMSGKQNRRLLIWSLLYFEIYLQHQKRHHQLS
ncbi:asparagine synthase (glutamine-hydrolyzing) [Alteromonas flava]|uniref:asparagine synthase (glutamine-hydrolyzing) n=1 Tax=Alteromonas flava TaxID=2048003 RepID=UPI000C28FBBE|nr:asparagine synthase (glutamine-hydrolyzing) [Alteromonas flava]